MEIEHPFQTIGIAAAAIREHIRNTPVSPSLEVDREDLARRIGHAEAMFDEIYRDFNSIKAKTQLHAAQRTSIIGGTE